jgi:hypothetical protein
METEPPSFLWGLIQAGLYLQGCPATFSLPIVDFEDLNLIRR